MLGIPFTGAWTEVIGDVGIPTGVAVYVYHHNCHEHHCLRLSWHPDEEGHPVCKVHSKDHPARGWFRFDRNHPRHAARKRRERNA